MQTAAVKVVIDCLSGCTTKWYQSLLIALAEHFQKATVQIATGQGQVDQDDGGVAVAAEGEEEQGVHRDQDHDAQEC